MLFEGPRRYCFVDVNINTVYCCVGALNEFIERDYIVSIMSSYLEKYHLQKVEPVKNRTQG